MPGPESATAAPAGAHPPTAGASAWVGRWLRPASGRSSLLDFACGSGRHARMAAELGYAVLAVDRDASALSGLHDSGVEVLREDLEHGRWSFASRRFDVIVCTNYLFRPRLELLCALLAEGGLLVYETFAAGNACYGRPSNPEYLLRRGELASVLQRAGLHLLAYEDGYCATPRAARLQRAAALRPPIDLERLPLEHGLPVRLG
jgi:SAM-dependent methyltransferase